MFYHKDFNSNYMFKQNKTNLNASPTGSQTVVAYKFQVYPANY